VADFFRTVRFFGEAVAVAIIHVLNVSVHNLCQLNGAE